MLQGKLKFGQDFADMHCWFLLVSTGICIRI